MDKQFLENLKSSISSTLKTAGDKTNKFIGIKKLEFEIGKVKNEIDRIYKDLGLKVYTIANTGSSDFGDLNAICNQINMKKEYISSLEKQIRVIKDDDKISEIPVKEIKKVPEFIKHPESSENIGVFKFCSDCNTGNEPTQENCKSCGKKL